MCTIIYAEIDLPTCFVCHMFTLEAWLSIPCTGVFLGGCPGISLQFQSRGRKRDFRGNELGFQIWSGETNKYKIQSRKESLNHTTLTKNEILRTTLFFAPLADIFNRNFDKIES